MEDIKILVVDDDIKVLNNITMLCSDFNISTESHPIHALERIQEEKFDILIIDCQMPVINGIEVLEEIQKIYAHNFYIGILCTASGTTYLFEEEKEQNLFSFFIEKPINEIHLKKVMEKAIGRIHKKKGVCIR